jgi:hypothetical protein
LKLFKQHCGVLVWISGNAVKMEKAKHAQTNEQVVAWNEAVKNMHAIEQDLSYLDIFSKSYRNKHKDNLHMDAEQLSDPLGGIFFKMINATA